MIAGATLIVMFPAENAQTGDKASAQELFLVLIFSMLATVCLSCEILVSKTLSRRGVNGKYVGFSFLLAEGILGTICLIGATIAGEGVMNLGFDGFWLMMLGGLSGVIAVSLLQYSVSIGIAGIVSSIFNTNVAFFTALCFFFLNQPLSMWQVFGIAVTTLGAVFLSINDDVFKCCCRRQGSQH